MDIMKCSNALLVMKYEFKERDIVHFMILVKDPEPTSHPQVIPASLPRPVPKKVPQNCTNLKCPMQ